MLRRAVTAPEEAFEGGTSSAGGLPAELSLSLKDLGVSGMFPEFAWASDSEIDAR